MAEVLCGLMEPVVVFGFEYRVFWPELESNASFHQQWSFAYRTGVEGAFTQCRFSLL